MFVYKVTYEIREEDVSLAVCDRAVCTLREHTVVAGDALTAVHFVADYLRGNGTEPKKLIIREAVVLHSLSLPTRRKHCGQLDN